MNVPDYLAAEGVFSDSVGMMALGKGVGRDSASSAKITCLAVLVVIAV